VIIRIPVDTFKVWGVRGSLRVKGEMNGLSFQSTLLPSGNGGHYMIVNKQMQKAADVRIGMEAQFRIEPNPQKRSDPVATPELEHVLRQSRDVRKFYESLSPSMRREIIRFISEAKNTDTRRRRSERMAERLLETMEAEVELPPIIRQFMVRNPIAAEGWTRMPPSHRRQHLLGIFYYRDPESRLRRIEKAVEEMIVYASRK